MENLLMTFINTAFGNLSNFNKWYTLKSSIFLYIGDSKLSDNAVTELVWSENELVFLTCEVKKVKDMTLVEIVNIMKDIADEM